MLRNRVTLFVVSIVILLVACFTVGCSKSIVTDDALVSSVPNITISKGDPYLDKDNVFWIVKSVQKLTEMEIISIFKKNEHLFLKDGKIDKEALVKFVLDNFGEFEIVEKLGYWEGDGELRTFDYIIGIDPVTGKYITLRSTIPPPIQV